MKEKPVDDNAMQSGGKERKGRYQKPSVVDSDIRNGWEESKRLREMKDNS